MAKDTEAVAEPGEGNPGIDPTGNPVREDPRRDRLANAESDRGDTYEIVDGEHRPIRREPATKVERATRAPGETR